MSVSEKRKHKTLTLTEKLDIVKRLEKGEKLVHLADLYGVGRATIYDIKKNKHKIECFLINGDGAPSKRQTLKSGTYPEMENAVYAWFLDERKWNASISKEAIKAKAKYFYKLFNGKDDFRASNSWFSKFKTRFGIQLSTAADEKVSWDDSVDPYLKKFQEKIDELNLGPDQIYSANRSVLFWRLLPVEAFSHHREECNPVKEKTNDRIMFMPCSNASGTHKLELLVVSNSKNYRAFTNLENNLPIIFKKQCSGLITRKIFIEWFHDSFIPSVKEFLEKQKLPKKALLVLDNAPGHPYKIDLKTEDLWVEVLFLPLNCPPVLQPLDQHIMQSIKINYKKSLLCSAIAKNDDLIKFFQETNFDDAAFSLASAWQCLSPSIIISSWKKLWPTHPLQTSPSTEETNDLVLHEAVAALCSTYDSILTREDIEKWLTGSEEESHIQFTLEDEVIEDSTNDEEQSELLIPSSTVKHSDAAAAFNTVIKWSEENNVSSADILTMRKLQEKAVMQSLKGRKQQTTEMILP